MIDMKEVLTAGAVSDNADISQEYVSRLEDLLNQPSPPSKNALKALMNYLIRLEERDDLPATIRENFGITQRLMYMRLCDALFQQNHALQDVDEFLFLDKPLLVRQPENFIEEFRQMVIRIFAVFQPYLEAEDDLERFSRVVDQYAVYIKNRKDVLAWVRFLRRFSAFCDNLYPIGYRKAHDGWGGKLDLDIDVYPLFFKSQITEEISSLGLSGIITDILYDRLKEVGEAETVLPDLYEFMESLHRDTSLKNTIAMLDKQLSKAYLKAIQDTPVKEAKGTWNKTILTSLPEYEQTEGTIYFYFDDKKLSRIMDKTHNATFHGVFLNAIRNYPPKTVHFLMYAFGKLLLAPESQVKLSEKLISVFCRELKKNIDTIYSPEVMNNLPAMYRSRIPDLEIRFFLNRIMTNTTTLEGFEALQARFREYLVDQSQLPLIHEIFIERAAEKRHASALMSFYIAALLKEELGDVVPDPILKILAGRLSLTYSFTRRFNLFKELKKLRYEYDGTHDGRETVYYNGFDRQSRPPSPKELHTPLKDRPLDEQWIILYHIINNRELQWALRLIDEEVLFDYILSRKDHEKDLQEARMELRGKVYKIIDDKFLDLFTDQEESEKRALENQGIFPVAYYGKYEKIRSIMIAQFIASGWDMEVYELKRKGRRPLIRMTQNELLRSIRNIDRNMILEQYEYKEARENIDVVSLRKQAEAREELLAFVNQASRKEVATLKSFHHLSDEAIALLSYISTKLRNQELRVELGIKQLVERLKSDLGLGVQREPLPLDTILADCFTGKYGKIDVKVIKKDKDGKPLIDPETGEEAEKTYTIAPNAFPEYLIPARNEILQLDKTALYRIFYLITLNSIIAETFSSLTFIKEALDTNKYVIAADGLKEQAIENAELLDYARIKYDMARQLEPYEIHH